MFLEERFPIDARLGANYNEGYGVETARDPRTGYSYRRLRAAQPEMAFTLQFLLETGDLRERVLALYHRAYAALAGFRVRNIDDYSSNGNTGTPAATDQTLESISSTVYQLQKEYGAGATPLSIGLPVRTVYKPVSGSVKIAVGGVEQLSGWSVDTTTGRVTFESPPGGAVTGGFYFDVPCRFSEKFDINHIAHHYRGTGTINLVELLNP
jgi:uncharacterized protein (TIGR02217 family)